MSKKSSTISFKSSLDFEKWFAKNGSKSEGIWLKIFKKDSGVATVTYAEALDVALCYGWIDGQKDKHDDQAWLQKFTPRRAKSGWSKTNTKHVARLIKEGRMKPAGLKEVAEAKKDGRWKNAYHPQSTATFPPEFLKMVAKNPKAQAFLDKLDRVNRYAMIYRLQTTKRPENKLKKMEQYVQMLAKGQTIHKLI